jgi:hypothetical protein
VAAVEEVKLLVEPMWLCKKGHVGRRLTKDRCSVCRSIESKKRIEKHGEKIKAYYKQWAPNNRDKTRKAVNAHAARNRDALRARGRRLYRENREDRVASAAKYREENKALVSARRKAWKQANPHALNEASSRRRAAKVQACPEWLTKEDFDAMKEIYEEAQMFSVHVDHIAPLLGREVCGLHVPWNLRLMLPSENYRKGNRLEKYDG